MDSEILNKIFLFLNKVGIQYQLASLNDNTFLAGIKIDNGSLLIDLDKLKHPGDILHEAGHIAISPEDKRATISGDAKDFGHSASDEMAAIAWSWAALVDIELSPETVFHPEGYKGGSESIIQSFQKNNGFGYPMLYSWYMCEMPSHRNGFPNMLYWFRSESNKT